MFTEAIPKHVSKAAGLATRFDILRLLNWALANSGVTPRTVAKRLEWKERDVKRFLKGKSKMRLRQMAEMLWAIDGSQLDFSLRSKETPPEPAETTNGGETPTT